MYHTDRHVCHMSSELLHERATAAEVEQTLILDTGRSIQTEAGLKASQCDLFESGGLTGPEGQRGARPR